MNPKTNKVNPQYRVSRKDNHFHNKDFSVEIERRRVYLEWQNKHAYRVKNEEHGTQKEAYNVDLRYETDIHARRFFGYHPEFD